MSIAIARAARRCVVAPPATGAFALTAPAVAQAATPLVLPPGSTIPLDHPARPSRSTIPLAGSATPRNLPALPC